MRYVTIQLFKQNLFYKIVQEACPSQKINFFL